MATFVQKYVNAASTGTGGDGSTNTPGSGGTAAYSSVSAGITKLNTEYSASFITADVQVDMQVTGQTTEGQVSTVIASDATRYLRIYPNPSGAHAGKYDTNYNGMKYTGSSTYFATGSWKYLIVENVHVVIDATGASAHGFNATGATGPEGTRLSNILLERRGTAGGTGFRFGSTNMAEYCYVLNCIIVGAWSNGIEIVATPTTSRHAFYNNTVYGATGNGIYITRATGTLVRMRNNRVEMPSGVCYGSNGFIVTPTYGGNISSDSTSPDGASYRSITGTYTNAGGGDLSIAAGDAGINLGVDLSADANFPISTDIVGVTRSATPTPGAWEYVAASGTIAPLAMYRKLLHR